MICPNCKHPKLKKETLYYDLLYSSMIEGYRYTCLKCGLSFEVQK